MYDEEISRGITLLDARLGRDVWLPRVDPITLDAGSVHRCPVAQATESRYLTGLRVLGLDTTLRIYAQPTDDCVRHGFNVAANADGAHIYDELTAAWRERITALKSNAGTNDDTEELVNVQ